MWNIRRQNRYGVVNHIIVVSKHLLFRCLFLFSFSLIPMDSDNDNILRHEYQDF